MTVGQIIKDARKRAGLSLKDLAARILKVGRNAHLDSLP